MPDKPPIRDTGPLDRNGTIAHARLLACEIDELLTAALEAEGAYSIRLAQAMTGSLIDQLEEIERAPASATRLTSARSA